MVRTPIESTKDELSQLGLFQSLAAQSQKNVSGPVGYGNSTIGFSDMACSSEGMEDLRAKYDGKTVQIVTSGTLEVEAGKVVLNYVAVGDVPGLFFPVVIPLSPHQMRMLAPHKDLAVAAFHCDGIPQDPQ